MQKNFKINEMDVINFTNLSKNDALQILQIRNDAKITKWMLTERKITEIEHFNFIENLKKQKNKVYFAVKSNNEILGAISLINIDLYNKNAFIGIYANPYLPRLKEERSIGSRIMGVLKHISFNELSLHIIFAKCICTNLLALRFYEKENFFQCGKLVESIKRDNKFIDVVILGLKKDCN